MEKTNPQETEELKDTRNAMERLRSKLVSASCSSKESIMDAQSQDRIEAKVNAELTKHDLRDIADTIRKDVFTARKEDKTPHVIGSVMGVIALISAVTAILTPMNNQTLKLAEEFKEHISVERQILKDHMSEQDTQLIRMEERIKEGLKEANSRIESMKADDREEESKIRQEIKDLAIDADRNHHQLLADLEKVKESDAIDKKYNMKLDMLEKLQDENRLNVLNAFKDCKGNIK